MKFERALFSFVLVVSGLVAAAPLLAASSYEVKASIEQNGKTVGEPKVVVRAGNPASVRVNGELGYSMDVTVTPVEDGLLRVSVKAETFKGSVSTGITTRAGKPIVVASGDLDLTMTVTEAGI